MPYSDIKLTESSSAKTFQVYGTDRNFDVNSHILAASGDVVVDAQGRFQFYDWIDGSNDMGNGKIVCGGDTFVLRGHAVEDLQNVNLDWDTGSVVSPVAYYCSVNNSQNTGTVDIDATDRTNTNAGGLNAGWYFGPIKTLGLFVSNIFNSLLFKR